ncbi:GNAT family N-acetyltransferase [Vogesella indigofera]|uniref:GNAT family N-acetyltransferase n=1 Tax=Vogesella indigofera TaxID=45465 RepID=UPI00234D2AC8|nr:GNAT family N-acetyltransferase [Vogesella indigofera]MDC7702718.1 GNAT family N-acetyltransferase [Vogesella indigofera]
MAVITPSDPLLDGIRTPRLVLVAPQAGDGAALFQAIVASQHELQGFAADLPWSQPVLDVALVERYCYEVQRNWQRGDSKVALLWLGDEVVGWLRLQHQPDESWLLQFWGHSDWQGQGLFTEAVERMLVLAFGHYQVRDIRVPVADSQQAAHRLCARLGMRLLSTPPPGEAAGPFLYGVALH